MPGREVAVKFRLRLSHKEALVFYLLILPWAIGIIGFSLGPITASLGMSLTEYDVLRPPRFIGLANFASLIQDDLFWQALKVTGSYTILAVPLGIILSLFLASLLNQRVPGLSFFRTVFYLPSVISGVAVSLLWMWLLNPAFGLINYGLRLFLGIQGPKWLIAENTVVPAFVLMSLWGVGGGLVIYLAALQSVPTELYEAVSLDGANAWQRFRHITLPMISPVILFSFVTGMIGSFQIVTQAYVISDGLGGPHYASLFYGLYVY